ncbi:MAG: carboxylesterase family protein [Deltaproteobacteria bacterium]|nr:carboxylesterase family protein [Deltaproteobacteria bacterium]
MLRCSHRIYHLRRAGFIEADAEIPHDAPFTTDQQQLSEAMISYWTQFAASGNPNSADEAL